MLDFTFKENYTFEDLLHIMEILRAPGGCMWDREQDHHSIRRNFIEETYEAIEAIDNDDAVLLQEELGDVLLQVVFHAQMEKEKGVFLARKVDNNNHYYDKKEIKRMGTVTTEREETKPEALVENKRQKINLEVNKLDREKNE